MRVSVYRCTSLINNLNNIRLQNHKLSELCILTTYTFTIKASIQCISIGGFKRLIVIKIWIKDFLDLSLRNDI